jgi:hypothetical protein
MSPLPDVAALIGTTVNLSQRRPPVVAAVPLPRHRCLRRFLRRASQAIFHKEEHEPPAALNFPRVGLTIPDRRDAQGFAQFQS